MEPLRRRADFEQVFLSGTFVRGRTVSLRILERGEGPTRIGFAVGKRLDKRAVIRNRVRRRLREVLRRLDLRDRYDVVVIARRSALTDAAPALREDVARVCGKAGLLGGEESG
ncbi:MAG: ribonuclease P protein component [Dehalococcoidia bacterium]|nr:ribonuclease P protein component [Dehalococcoidia bacterium]MYK26071.1 ribonuclease P protein component [Dehalococcoidia bacterium]